MADANDGLFTNPTTRQAADNLEQSRRSLLDTINAPGPTQAEMNELFAGIGPKRGPVQTQQQPDINPMQGLAEIADTFPSTTPLDPKSGVATPEREDGQFWGTLVSEREKQYDNMGLGASLVRGDIETNMMALEQRYQRALVQPNDAPQFTPEPATWSEEFDQFANGKSRWLDADFYGNLVGGTLPSIETMIGGAATGGVAASVVPGVGTATGALTGAVAGSSGGVGLQTLGSTATEAYNVYRGQGMTPKQAYKKAREVANVDAFKSGALAGLATLIAPGRVLFGRAGAAKVLPSGVSYGVAPVGESLVRTTAIQFGQQSLVLQPTLEVADVISSNVIAKNSYDPQRVITRGAIDAGIASILLDTPTTVGGIMVQRVRRRRPDGTDVEEFIPALDDPVQTEPTPDLLALPAPEPLLALPRPRFEAQQQEDGTWSVIDTTQDAGETAAPFVSPETERSDQAVLSSLEEDYAQARARVIALEEMAQKPKNYNSRLKKAQKSQDEAAEAVQAQQDFIEGRGRAVEVDPEVFPTPVPTITNEYGFSTEEAAQAEAAKRNEYNQTEWSSPWYPDSRQSRQTFAIDQAERIRAYDERRRRDETDYNGSPKVSEAIKFFQWLGEADGIIDEINSMPAEERNTQRNTARLEDARDRLAILKIWMDPVRNQARPHYVFIRNNGQQYTVQMDDNGKVIKPKDNFLRVYDPSHPSGIRDLAISSGQLVDESISMPTNMLTSAEVLSQVIAARRRMFDQEQETLLLAPPEEQTVDTVEGDTSEVTIDSRSTDAPIVTTVQRPDNTDSARETRKEARDKQDVAQVEEYKDRTRPQGVTADGTPMVNEEGVPLYQDGTPMEIRQEPGAGQVEVEGDGQLELDLAKPNTWRTEDTEPEADEQPEDTAEVTRERRTGLVQRVLDFVPAASRPLIERMLNMYADTMGAEFNEVKIMDLARWLGDRKSDSDIDPATAGAIFHQYFNQITGKLERTIAINRGRRTQRIYEDLSHELVHLAVQLKKLPERGMVEWYNDLDADNPYKIFVDQNYANESVEVRAEETLAAALTDLSMGRYRGRLKEETGLQYLLRQVIRMVREMFEGITGTNYIDAYFEKVRAYGVDTVARNPFDNLVRAKREEAATEDNAADQAQDMGIAEAIDAGDPRYTNENPPEKTKTTYKLFRIDASRPGELFPLFVDALTPVPVGQWIDAKMGTGFSFQDAKGNWYVPSSTRSIQRESGDAITTKSAGKRTTASTGRIVKVGPDVRAKLIQEGFLTDKAKVDADGNTKVTALSRRPGWHSGNNPAAIHIGEKSAYEADGPDYRPYHQVWAEVEVAADVDWQAEANKRGKGRDAHITDQLPEKGFYNYKTTGTMAGDWVISGEMRINRVLTDSEVAALNEEAGIQDLPRLNERLDAKEGVPQEIIRYSIIPEHKRAQRPKPPAQAQLHSDGQPYRQHNLTDTSAKIKTLNFDVATLWQEVKDKYGPEGQLLLDILAAKNENITVEPMDNAFWLRSLSLPDRARFWYEISSERFASVFRAFNDPAFRAKIIDVVAATSVQAGPLDNLLRTISVMSEVVQDKAIRTDLTDKGQGAGVNKALSDTTLPGDKTGNFAGTMNYLMGLTDTVPLSTNDRQVAVYFNTNGEMLANTPKVGIDADGNKVQLPSFYDMISEFHIKLRDRLNDQLPVNAEPFETWQLQALGWVQIRAENNAKKGDVSGYDDYDQVIDEVFKRLKAAGVNVSSGELGPATLSDPRVPYALRDTLKGFMTSPIATVETLTQLTDTGNRFQAAVKLMRDKAGTQTALKDASKVTKRTLNDLAARKKKNPSLVSRLVSVIANKTIDLSRVETGWGTYEGDANYNLRIPLGVLDADQRRIFLSVLGQSFNQDAMAVHQLHDAQPGSAPRKGMKRTYRVFLKSLDRDALTPADTEAFDVALGSSDLATSGVRVANGNVIDVMVGGYDGVLTREQVEAAVDASNLSKFGEVFIYDMDYLSVEGADFITRTEVDWGDTGRGYLGNINEDFVKGTTDGTIQEIFDLDDRITREQSRDFVYGEINDLSYWRTFADKTRDPEQRQVSKSVLGRAQRIRNLHGRRIGDFRQIEAELSALNAKAELTQIEWLQTHLPKVWSKLSPEDQKALGQPYSLDSTSDIGIEEIEPILKQARADITRLSTRSYQEASTSRKKKIAMAWSRKNLTQIFTSSAKRVRQLGKYTDAAYRLGNMLDRDQFAATKFGEKGIIEADVHNDISELSARYSGQYTQLLRGLTREQKADIAHILRGRDRFQNADGKWIIPLRGFPQAKAQGFRQLLDTMWNELESVYAEQGRTPPRKLRNYFPQKYMLDGEIDGVSKEEAAKDFFTAVFSDPNMTPGQRNRARSAAQAVIDKIKGEGYQPVWGHDTDRALASKLSQITSQELKRIIDIDPYQKWKVGMPDGTIKEMALVDFLDNNYGDVLNGYMLSMARRISFARRFGVDGQILGNMINATQTDVLGKPLGNTIKRDENGQIVYQRDKKGNLRKYKGQPVPVTEGELVRGELDQDLIKEGYSTLNPEDRQTIIELLRLNMGLAKPLSKKWRNKVGLAKFAGNIALLNLTTFTSLTEPVLIGARLGMRPMLSGIAYMARSYLRIPKKVVKATYNTLQDGPQPSIRDKWTRFREHYHYDMLETREFAKDLGIIFENMQYVLQNSVEDVGPINWEKINNVYFRSILLQPLTELQMAAALQASLQSLHTWRRQARRDPKHRAHRHLRELGLTVADLDLFDKQNPKETSNAKVRAALRDMNKEIIMAPDPGRKPGWMSDPRWQLVSHIKTWIFTFNNTVLQRSWRELMAHGNPLPLVYLAGFGLSAALAYEWREWMRYGEEGNPYMNKLGLEKGDPMRFAYLMLERGGLMGPFQLVSDLMLGTRVGSGSGYISNLVPSLNVAERVLTGLAVGIQAPMADDPAKQWRRSLDNLSRATPFLNAMGNYRTEFINELSGYTPGRKKKKTGARGKSRGSSRGSSRSQTR